MAVVTKYASGYQDPAVKPVDALPVEEVRGTVKLLVSTVAVANGDSIASKLYFGKIPSNARIMTNSLLEHDALTGVASFDLGEKTADDCLMTAVNITAAGTKDATGNITIANLRKPFWAICGYAADPGGELDIFGTLDAAATAAGNITLSLLYALP